MLLSRNLLNKINPNFSTVSDNDLSAALNAIGIEVESITKNKVNPNLKLGRLISFKPHPNSERLNICDVVVEDKKVEIVCGAPGLQANQWVVVALPGTELQPNVVIETREIRGVLSNGMLCSLKEILPTMGEYISDADANTIIQIPHTYKLKSTTFFDEFGFNDTIFDLSLPSNRPELNGVYFLAYELNLQFNFNTKLPKQNLFLQCQGLFKKQPNLVTVDLPHKLNYHLLKLNLSLTIETIWQIKLFLINSGIKAQNNCSDLSNFVTTLFAQPVLCMDKKLVGDKLFVCELNAEAEIVTTNNKKLTLHPGTIVTKNASDEIVSVTGMYLSNNFIANLQASEVYLELANLSADYMMKINAKNNYHDNLSNYFLKSPANNVAKLAISWLGNTHNQFIKAITSTDIIVSSKHEAPKVIYFSFKKLTKLLGVKVKFLQLFYIFKKIGIIFLGYKVFVPSYRNDLNNLTDLAEEVLKAIDINKLTVSPIKFEINDFKQNSHYKNLNAVRNFFVNKQFFETKTYNLTSEKAVDLFNWFGIENAIQIQNPISQDKKVLRKNLVNEMLNVLAYNQQHKQLLANIFEIQKIQFSDEQAHDVLCCLLVTDAFNNPLDKSVLRASDYTNKALYDGLEEALGFKLRKQFNVGNYKNVYEANNFALFGKDNEFIGLVGQIKNSCLNDEYKLNKPVYFICLNLDLALQQQKNAHTFWKVSDLNPIYKDITFSNPEQIDLKDITRKLLDIPLVTMVNLVDVYEKDGVKSYTITIKIQPNNKNLVNEEIAHIFQTAITTLKTQKLVVKE